MFEIKRATKYADIGRIRKKSEVQPLISDDEISFDDEMEMFYVPSCSPVLDKNSKNENIPCTIDRFRGIAKKVSDVSSKAPNISQEKPHGSNNNLSNVSDEKMPDIKEATRNTGKAINRFKIIAEKSNPSRRMEYKTENKGIEKEEDFQDVINPKTDAVNQSNADLSKDETELADKTSRSRPLNRFINAAKKTSEDNGVTGNGVNVNEIMKSNQGIPFLPRKTENLKDFTSDESSMKNGLKSSNRLSAAPKLVDVVKTVSTVNKASKVMTKQKMKLKLKEQMKKIIEERLSVKQIFARYVEASTLHGFRYTCSDTYIIRRVIWAVLMILGFIYFLVKLDSGIREYLSWPFSTLSTLDYVDDLEFPTISICLLNQYRYSKIMKSPLKKLYMEGRLPLRSNWSDVDYDIHGDELANEIMRTSFSLEDILKGCDYIRRDTEHPDKPKRYCGVENFTSYFSDSGQICYKLNSHEPGYKKLGVRLSGLRFGIDLTFDLNNADAIMTSDIAALQVIVHHPNEPPTYNSGFMISPGFKTYVNMQRVETANLPPPYATQCGEKKLRYFDVYNQKACLLEQLTIYTGEKCGCREPFMPDNGLPYCSLTQTLRCMYPARESFNTFKMRSVCPLDCTVVNYNNRISSSRFLHNPPTGVEPNILEVIEQMRGNFTTESHVLHLSKKHNSQSLDKYIEQNVIVVLFFFGEMSVLQNEQEVSFDFYQFLGDMGGEIGLMLGASLLTFVEFIDLFLFLIYHQLLRLNKREEKREKTTVKENNNNIVEKEKNGELIDSLAELSPDWSKDESAQTKPLLDPINKSLPLSLPVKQKNGNVPWIMNLTSIYDTGYFGNQLDSDIYLADPDRETIL